MRPREFLEAELNKVGQLHYNLAVNVGVVLVFCFIGGYIAIWNANLDIVFVRFIASASFLVFILVPNLIHRNLLFQEKLFYDKYTNLLLEKFLLANVLEQPDKMASSNLLSRISSYSLQEAKQPVNSIPEVFQQLSTRFNLTAKTYGVNPEFPSLTSSYELIVIFSGVLWFALLNGFLYWYFELLPYAISLFTQLFLATFALIGVPSRAKGVGLRKAICDAFLE